MLHRRHDYVIHFHLNASLAEMMCEGEAAMIWIVNDERDLYFLPVFSALNMRSSFCTLLLFPAFLSWY